MYFLMCFLMRVFGTITGKITTEYLTPGYYQPVTGVLVCISFQLGPDKWHESKETIENISFLRQQRDIWVAPGNSL